MSYTNRNFTWDLNKLREFFLSYVLAPLRSLVGYYECGTAASQAAKTVTAAWYSTIREGGSMKIKFTNKNTAASGVTLKIGPAAAKPLYYGGAAVDATNTWDDGETVEVYYDGTSYYANNVAGGSGGDGAFDLSAKTGDSYETLSAALTAANSAIPPVKKKGGMSMKFILHTPASYRVVKTEGLDEQPSGYVLMDDPGIGSGTYNAGQLSAFGTLPTSVGSGNAVTYYMADFDGVTTYTKWVITLVQSSDNKYVQYWLMSQSFSTTESDWQNIGLVQQAGQSKTVAMSQKAVTDELNKIDSKTAIVVDDDSQANLNIGDQQGNVIVEFKDGHIKTKEFDSSKSIKSINDDSSADLNIGDEEGNVIAQFKDGHIKTKNFDSSQQSGGNSSIIIAASNTPSIRKKNASYLCTGTNDDIYIQNIINSADDAATIVLLDGDYSFDNFSFYSDGGNKSCLALKKNQKLIGFRVGKVNNFGTRINVSQQCYDVLDDNTQYSVIRNIEYNDYWKQVLTIENVCITLPDNQKNIICIDAFYSATICVQNFVVRTRPDQGTSTSGLKHGVHGCIGVRGTQGSNNGWLNYVRHGFAWGFYVAYALSGEHLIAQDLSCRYNDYGYYFNMFAQTKGAYTHPMTIINCADELNFNMPRFGHNGESSQTDELGGNQAITLINFNLEWLSDFAAMGGDLATEDTPGEWKGEIYYTIQPSYGGNSKNSVTQAFWTNGSGINIKSINQAQKQIATKEEVSTYAPNYNQILYCSDLNKPIICIDPIAKHWIDFSGEQIVF